VVIEKTDFKGFDSVYHGKVRDTYLKGDKRIFITTDKLSCFDRIVTTIPYKGAVLNSLATYWLNKTKEIVPNHLLSVPHPNVMIGKNCTVFPVEVVVRGYLAGSAWRSYKKGEDVSGIKLPPGLLNYHRFEEPIITPSTKAKTGDHDEPISEVEIISSGLVPQWAQVREYALSLFNFGSKEVEKRGLILADTKFEFGLFNGEVTLVDEIFTLDSTRYWESDSYEAGKDPVMLDKEVVRQWLISQGFMGEGDIPFFSDEKREEISKQYIDSVFKITGVPFDKSAVDSAPNLEEIIQVLFG